MSTSTTHAGTNFELEMSLPREPRFAEVVRRLAVHAALHSGGSDAAADAFGREVEDVARGALGDPSAAGHVAVTVRRATTGIDVRIDTRTLTLNI